MAEGTYGDCRDECMQYQIEGEHACQSCFDLDELDREREQAEEADWL
ncbi:MAG: hypothetical protein OEX09_01985 [Candidatus Bathyarchaeota archaeon]|nr:hypothetical protein [Candidatus Bathyarchaeota archaeon]